MTTSIFTLTNFSPETLRTYKSRKQTFVYCFKRQKELAVNNNYMSIVLKDKK